MYNIQCPNCNYKGKAKRFTGGSFLTELLLWLMFILPGIIYSLWRLTTPYVGCPQCGWKHVIKT